jgi:hypothetical protein
VSFNENNYQDCLNKGYILVNLKNDVIDFSQHFNVSVNVSRKIEDLKILIPEDTDIVIPKDIIKNKKDIYLYSFCFLEVMFPVVNRKCHSSEDIERRLNEFISKAKPIGWPFTNSDAEIYAIDKDINVILELSV